MLFGQSHSFLEGEGSVIMEKREKRVVYVGKEGRGGTIHQDSLSL